MVSLLFYLCNGNPIFEKCGPMAFLTCHEISFCKSLWGLNCLSFSVVPGILAAQNSLPNTGPLKAYIVHCMFVKCNIIQILLKYIILHLVPLGWAGPCFNVKTIFPGIWILMIKIRQPWDHLIFTMGIPIPVRQHFYIESVPGSSTIRINFIVLEKKLLVYQEKTGTFSIMMQYKISITYRWLSARLQ